MKKQDVITGILVITILVVGVFLIGRAKSKKNVPPVPLQTPTIESRVSDKFGGLQIPTDVDRADLKGDTGVGIVTRNFDNGRFELTVLADLPAPEEGKFYQAWLLKGDVGKDGSSLISASKLRVAKGGYLAEFTANEDYSEFKKVIITLESTFDQTPEKIILEGSF